MGPIIPTMSKIGCKEKHVHRSGLRNLPKSTSDFGVQFMCARCAYAQGFKAGEAGTPAPTFDPASLSQDESGETRHKSAYVAWALGFLEGTIASYREADPLTVQLVRTSKLPPKKPRASTPAKR